MLGPPEYTEKGKTWFMFTRSLQSSWGGNVKKKMAQIPKFKC